MKDHEAAKCRIVLASHGTLAAGLVESAQVLLGKQDNIEAYGLLPTQKMESFAGSLREEIDAHGAEKVLFMTDLMNGTPFNAVVSLVRYYPVIYHITGVNLATLLGALVARNAGASMEEICDAAMEAAEGSILDVRKLLEGLGIEEEE